MTGTIWDIFALFLTLGTVGAIGILFIIALTEHFLAPPPHNWVTSSDYTRLRDHEVEWGNSSADIALFTTSICLASTFHS